MRNNINVETTVLDNGITVYAKPMDVPFAYAWLYVPVGHVHNTGAILPGSAHFLEHMVCKRSALYPEIESYEEFVALNGGGFAASTDIDRTEYTLKIPSTSFIPAFKGLVSKVFEPLFHDEDMRNEIGIISSERKKNQGGQWYPGHDKLGQHCLTKWKYRHPLTIRQRLGEDSDLECMNIQGLRSLHRAYFDPRVYLMIGGTYDHDLVCKELSRIQTVKHRLPEQFAPLQWVHREYHEETFPDLHRFLYHIGGIVTERDPQIAGGNAFLSTLLVNTVHGVLFDWLRRDLRWSYDVGIEFNQGNGIESPDWELWLPVDTYEQAQRVRAELHGRIQVAIQDQQLLNVYLERKLAGQVFWYQTLGSVMEELESLIVCYGRAIPEDEAMAILERCRDRTFLQGIYDKYWSPDVSGEFLAIPEKV